ncbi:ABC transporter permease [Nocardia sp. NPDC003482]
MISAATAARTSFAENDAPVMEAWVGTLTLLKFQASRDRGRLILWIVGLALWPVLVLASLGHNYPTRENRQNAGDLFGLPAVTAMVGNNYQPWNYTFGIMLGHMLFIWAAMPFALMSILLAIRYTRLEEELRRTELLRARALGRHAQLSSAVVLVAAVNIVTGAVVAAGLAAFPLDGISVSGSGLYGVSLAAVGIAFLGITTLAAQITEFSSTAISISLSALGTAYVVRAIGDVSRNPLSWLSPLYWGFATHPYADAQRYWPLLVPVLFALVTLALSLRLSTNRDVGAGLRPPRPGASSAAATLLAPHGLAGRLLGMSAVSWTIGLVVFGVMYGSVLGTINELLADLPAFQKMVRPTGGASMSDSWIASTLALFAILAAVQGMLTITFMRKEERSGRAEPVLAAVFSRSQWAGGNLLVGIAGSTVTVVCAGLGYGISGALATGDHDVLVKVMTASAANIPAVWLTLAITMAVYGAIPQFLEVVWLIPVYAIVAVWLGDIFGLPGWAKKLSPFGYISNMPAEPFALLPTAALVAVAVVLGATGGTRFRHRDLHLK